MTMRHAPPFLPVADGRSGENGDSVEGHGRRDGGRTGLKTRQSMWRELFAPLLGLVGGALVAWLVVVVANSPVRAPFLHLPGSRHAPSGPLL